jgi:uncharacterized protein YndB with AHSA1/START domain
VDARSETAAPRNDTTVDRRSERELVVTRVFDAPARIVFEAWTTPELLMRWWAPESFGITLLSCDTDVRPGGTYRFVFADPESGQPIAFVGRYIEVVPHTRLVWTNEESDDGAITTLTFEERDGRTHLLMHDLYPSREALDEAMASGNVSGLPEQFNELDLVLESLNQVH